MRYLITGIDDRMVELSVSGGLWKRDADGDVVDLSGLVSVSGLADAHIHVSSDRPDFVPSDPARIRERLVAELEGGVFLCLDKGWSDDGVLAVVDDPLEARPALQAAGSIVAGIGGYYPGAVREVAPDDLASVVASHPRAGGWFKIIGDWPKRGQGAPPAFGVESLTAAVAAAHARDLRVSIHTMAPDTPSIAVEAGVDSIEHGLFLTDDDIRALGARGGAWVPTVRQVERVIEEVGPERTGGRLLRTGLDRVRSLAPQATAAGVTVLAGSDFGTPQGRIGVEAIGLAEHGFTPADALRSVTSAAYGYVGEPYGFEPGFSADVVAFEHHPHERIETLSDPVFVMRRGRVLLDRRTG
jgi:imidazolonepropionase-like amidohydrolase